MSQFSCNDLDERPFNSRIASNQLQIPTAMISLDMWMPPSSFVDQWGLIDVGQLGPAGRLNINSVSNLLFFWLIPRFGWFIPSRTEEQYPPLKDHWRVFQDKDSLDPFLFTDDQLDFIKKRVFRTLVTENGSRCVGLYYYQIYSHTKLTSS